MKKFCILVRGIPGSDKSTFGASLSESLGVPKIEDDDFFSDKEGKYCFLKEGLSDAHAECQQRAIRAASNFGGVIIYNTLNIEEIYNTGFAHGQNLVHCNIYDTKLKGLNSDDIEEFKDRVRDLCWEADEYSRQYTPFEFFCHDMNSAENSEEAWEAYEKGIGDGINAVINDFCEELDFEEYLNSHNENCHEKNRPL